MINMSLPFEKSSDFGLEIIFRVLRLISLLALEAGI
jgi:hypothetical protein